MEQTQNRRKGALVALAALLVCALSVFGTIAYLSTFTQKVHNTFTAGDVSGIIQLLETPTVKTAQDYVKRGTPVDAEGKTYYVLPGTVIEKDTFVKVSDLTEEVYVYAAVSPSGFDAMIDGSTKLAEYALNSDWVALMDGGSQVYVEVTNGDGDPESWPIYVFKEPVKSTFKNGVDTPWTSYLLNPQTIKVNDYKDMSEEELDKLDNLRLDFQAYMVQTASGPDTAFTELEAWNQAKDSWNAVVTP